MEPANGKPLPKDWQLIEIDSYLADMTVKTGNEYKVRIRPDGMRSDGGKTFFKMAIWRISPEGNNKLVYESRLGSISGNYNDDYFYADYDLKQKRFLVHFFM
jgi:hypothetical protein